jgi:pimeloyl-ACP methyl ester carboxylesterase
MTRAAALALVVVALAGCRGPRPAADAGSCTHVQATREVRGVAVCEDVWTCARPPGGPFDRVGLRRVALCDAATGPVVVYFPGMHMSARIPVPDPRHDLRLYLAAAGFRTWGVDYRSHNVPPAATPADLAALAAWTTAVYADDAAWAAAFARAHDPGPLFLAGFSWGAGLAYRVAAREPQIAGLVVLDGVAPAGRGAAPGEPAVDVGSSRLPYEARARLLAAAMTDPAGASPLPGYATAGDALADVLWSSRAFGGAGGLSAARDGVSDVRSVARLLAADDRWWPRAALAGDAVPAPAQPLPVFAFASTRMGADWVARVRASAERFGGPDATVRALPGYGHLDLLVGRRAARDVFEPARAWLAARAAR